MIRVSAVLVTKGDHDLAEIFASLEDAGIRDVVVWDNSKREDLSCYGRYAGIAEAKNPHIFHQDDDCVVPVAEIIEAYQPRKDRHTVVANNRADEEWRLTGMGSVFHRSLAEGCFDRYCELYGYGPEFFRVCDVVFAYQHPYRRLVLGYRELGWARDPDRMYHQPYHMASREQALQRVQEL